MMRVGLVCPYSLDVPGGVQNHVLGLAGYLASHGHQPHVLAPGAWGPPAGRRSAEPAAIRFTSAGTAVPVPYNGSIARVNFGPLSATRVSRWMRGGGFDLLHVHEPITPSVALLALWAADCPVVATFHTATPRSRSMRLAGGALRAAIEKIDAGIAVSEAARRVVVEHLGRDAVVVPNGFRFADFARPGAPYRGGTVPRITFLGRVDEPRKGLGVLLAALPAVRSALGPVDVVIAGQGAAAVPAGCRMLGAVDDAEKARLLASTDVFVAPHLARESFGIVLLEAMAAGAPVVASALPAFADLLRGPAGEPVGRLFPIGDSAALARAVVETVRDPVPERTWAAVRHARRFDWERVGAKITAIYRAASALAPTGTRP